MPISDKKQDNLDILSVNTIRTLSMDAVQKAKSGHPGMPMGAAPMAYVLWTKYMRFNPSNPEWLNRDRFILSAGHGCMLQYSLLYLTGYGLTLDDIKQFRQFGSRTPGHPELNHTPGIEVTTGPLGQGFANGVGMAIAQKFIAERYNKPGYDIFDYNIYAITSDGDMMEGVSSEAASIAGFLKLGNLVYFYDDNHISIEGSTDLTFTEDVSKRFEAYGWHVQFVEDGNDIEALSEALKNAIAEKDKPSLIRVRTHIAYGSPNKQDTADSHGSPLGEDEVKLTKKNLGWDPGKYFYVPDEVLAHFREAKEKGKQLEHEWKELFVSYKKEYPHLAEELEMLDKQNYRNKENDKFTEWKKHLPVFKKEEGSLATRQASGKVINAIADYLPALMGGSADLAPSTDTLIKNSKSFAPGSYSGRNMHFGVREHSMGSILNGMAATKGIIPYGATFLVFSDYMRPPIRLAAIMGLRPIYVFTHDSIGLGEDGPTHQPVEQLMALRLIPNMTVIRPADANETSFAWKAAIEHTGGPVAIVLTRQKLPIIDRDKYGSAEGVTKGAYILSDIEGNNGNIDLILIATGSEVTLALGVKDKLQEEGINARVVSMPSWELFEKQDDDYKEKVLPSNIRKRLAIEAGIPAGWRKYVTEEGEVFGVNKFGESAPGEVVMKEYGFTVENILLKAKKLAGKIEKEIPVK
ncbi:MAG: transketolase [Ignavibacteriae bacterium]|nr:MAG: transketolase [Ignavibacteriota bacterium]